MNMIDCIEKKKNKESLTKEEIEYVVSNFAKGVIPDYQMSALLMAIRLNGMTREETVDLTTSMVNTGETIDLSSIDGICIDKHSTGGVGDKTSLVVAPMMAACGLYVAKMSGRGLGHTGGTLDKLESIPGVTIDISKERFLKQVQDIRIAIIGQSEHLVVADKKMYALRDVTGTVDSIPLIASSIMSKKIASGAKVLVLDVKYGNGAFMKDIESANELGRWMEMIGEDHGIKVESVISPMDQPLGFAIGNRNEVLEAIDTLKGHGPSDLLETAFELGESLLVNAGVATDKKQARQQMQAVIDNQEAYHYLEKMIEAQGGSLKDFKLNDIPTTTLIAKKDGVVSKIHAINIGHAAMILGAGREKQDDVIDFDAGVVLHAKEGAIVKQGDALVTLYSHRSFDAALKMIEEGIVID